MWVWWQKACCIQALKSQTVWGEGLPAFVFSHSRGFQAVGKFVQRTGHEVLGETSFADVHKEAPAH
jgi:hypothetical protein